MKMKWIEVEDTSTGHAKRNAAIGAACAAGLAGAAAIVAKRRHSHGDDDPQRPSATGLRDSSGGLRESSGGTHQMPQGVRSPLSDRD